MDVEDAGTTMAGVCTDCTVCFVRRAVALSLADFVIHGYLQCRQYLDLERPSLRQRPSTLLNCPSTTRRLCSNYCTPCALLCIGWPALPAAPAFTVLVCLPHNAHKIRDNGIFACSFSISTDSKAWQARAGPLNPALKSVISYRIGRRAL